jgi:secreted trypsin-like serine protease
MLLLYLLFLLLPISTLTHKHKYSCRSNAPCGCSVQHAILSKVVGGEIVRKRSWGWLVSLNEYSNHTHFCGGSILSSSWILTAAHCVYSRNASSVTIHAGSNKLYQSSQNRKVAQIFSHPEFESDTYVNDIALIQLSSPLDMNDPDLAKICLPPQIGRKIL